MTQAETRTPSAEYARRSRTARKASERCARRAALLSNARLATFVIGVGLGFVVFGPNRLPPAWLAPPVVLFLILVVRHDRVLREQERATRTARYYEGGMARLEYRFPEAAPAHAAPLGLDEAADHLYAEDLDLFGAGSLYSWLCRARTQRGRALLAAWLQDPAEPEEIRLRQGAVAELRDALDFRERLALVGEEVAPQLHGERLVAWGAGTTRGPATWERALAAVLPLVSTAALGAWWLFDVGPLLWVLGLTLQSAMAMRLRARVRACSLGIERVGHDLDLLAELLACLEAESFQAPRLVALRQAVESDGVPPSRRIHQLRRLHDLLDARRNQFFAPIGAALLFTTQVSLAIEAWRARCGPKVESWVNAVAELEALSSLATQAYERPEDPFPEIVEEGPRFEAEALGHPLLSEQHCVPNDLRLASELRLFVVSGSNMSGKSTLLRAVGTNAILALAGGTVRARRLQLSPLAVCASIRIHDSLLEGTSRFYAEIKRLRAVVERTRGALPVLFLLDEILHGTNSHDRRIGAAAVIQSLVEAGGVGLVTTHDLALASVAETLAPRAANVHFEDQLEAGRMSFDYRLRPGVVTKSNALALMRSVGLEV